MADCNFKYSKSSQLAINFLSKIDYFLSFEIEMQQEVVKIVKKYVQKHTIWRQ